MHCTQGYFPYNHYLIFSKNKKINQYFVINERKLHVKRLPWPVDAGSVFIHLLSTVVLFSYSIDVSSICELCYVVLFY